MPKRPRPPHPPHRRHVPASAIASFIDPARIGALLAPWVPDPEERAFVVRCLLEEGPAHHRGANYVILALLGELAGDLAHAPADEDTLPVPMRLPPHLAEDKDDTTFPLRLPKRPIARLAPEGSPEFQAMVDCLTDGPPQHALGNAAMVALLAVLLERKGAR